MTQLATIANAAVALALVIGYVVLTALGDDGTPLLLLLGGQGMAVGAAHGADAVKRGTQ